MLWNQIEQEFSRVAPLTQEFIQLLQPSLHTCEELRERCLARLVEQAADQDGLRTLVEEELRSSLFSEAFCSSIPPLLKSLRRALLRLEDASPHTAAAHGGNDLQALLCIAERVEGVFQQHWEFHRYHQTLSAAQVFSQLLELDGLVRQWQGYLAGFTALAALVQAHAQPAEHAPGLQVRMRLPRQQPASTHDVRSLLALLEYLHEFIGQAHGEKSPPAPLLRQLESGSTLSLELSIQPAWRPACHRLLQHLFLKDVLGQEPLVKVLMEATWKEACGKSPPAALARQQKQLGALLQALPSQAAFQVGDVWLPQDSATVLHSLMQFLEAHNLSMEALLRGGRSKGKQGGAAAAAAQPLLDPPAPTEPSPPQPQPPGAPPPGSSPAAPTAGLPRDARINLLTQPL